MSMKRVLRLVCVLIRFRRRIWGWKRLSLRADRWFLFRVFRRMLVITSISMLLCRFALSGLSIRCIRLSWAIKYKRVYRFSIWLFLIGWKRRVSIYCCAKSAVRRFRLKVFLSGCDWRECRRRIFVVWSLRKKFRFVLRLKRLLMAWLSRLICAREWISLKITW